MGGLPQALIDILNQRAGQVQQSASAMPAPDATPMSPDLGGMNPVSGVNQQMPIDDSGTPLSPDMGGMNPSLANAPQQRAQNGPLKAMLTNFGKGLGEYLSTQFGVNPQQRAYRTAELQQAQARPAYTQAQTQDTQLDVAMKQRRMAAMQNMGQNDPFASLGELNGNEQAQKDAAMQLAQISGDPSHIHQTIDKIASQRAIFGRSMAGKTTVTPELVKQYPTLAPFVGKQIGVTDIAGLIRGEGISNAVVNTPDGPVVANKRTGEAKAVTLNGKRVADEGIARTWAGHKAGATYKDVTVPEYDENGEPTGRYVTTNALTALQTGTPTVARPNLLTVGQRQALITDMSGALENVRKSGSELDWSASARTARAVAAKDAKSVGGQVILGEAARNLSPADRQFVIDTKVAQEALQSLRPILGAGQGSDLQRELGLATNPSMQTPDKDYLNKQIDAVQGMLTRVKPGTTSLAKPKFGPPAQKGAAATKTDAAAAYLQQLMGKH